MSPDVSVSLLCLTVSLPLSLSASLPLSVFVCVCLSLSVCLCLYLKYLCISVSLSLSLSLSLSVCLSVCLSLSLSLSKTYELCNVHVDLWYFCVIFQGSLQNNNSSLTVLRLDKRTLILSWFGLGLFALSHCPTFMTRLEFLPDFSLEINRILQISHGLILS